MIQYSANTDLGSPRQIRTKTVQYDQYDVQNTPRVHNAPAPEDNEWEMTRSTTLERSLSSAQPRRAALNYAPTKRARTAGIRQ